MSYSPRWVLVDDTSPDIKYIGASWRSYSGNPTSNEVWGLPYLNTIHGTNSNASLAYNFTGSAVRVKGTVHTQNISGVIDPTWDCFVDGIRIERLNTGATNNSMNNYDYCERSGLDDGLRHTLFVTTTVSKQQTFWFDRIEYVPSSGESLEDKTLIVSTYQDSAFRYSSGWINGVTGIMGSSVSFDFVGTSLAWYADYSEDQSSSRTTATWSIDSQAEQNAALPDHKRGSNLFNQKLFDTGPLGMGIHRLKVTYNGISDSYTPLNLTYLIIQNGTLPSTTTSVPTSTSGSNTRSRNIGAVVGGTVGLAALLAIFFIYWYRRNSRKSAKESFKESTPYVRGPNLRYTYHPRDGGAVATALDAGTNPAISHGPGTLSTSSQVIDLSRVLLQQGVDTPDGSVIHMPPEYSLH